MPVELRPMGVKCNIRCEYCYQNPQRDAGNVAASYDLEKMKEAIESEASEFTLFGGEPLMIPIGDLEKLWRWGYEKFGKNGLQTNGSLITDRHILLFKAFKVQIGVSVDGPGELNAPRRAGTLNETRKVTDRVIGNIQRLCREGITPSLIVTLHRANATADKLPLMNEWFRELEQMGITSVRLHALEVEDEAVRETLSLSEDQLIRAFENFRDLEDNLSRLKFDVFNDMRKLLRCDDNHTTCVWNACDPFTTRAVRGVEGTGQRTNCGRTNKEGIDFVKSDSPGFERYTVLYHTPQEYGGCSGCRFFLACKGQCPGTAIDGDWRNRTEHCGVWMRLYERLETDMLRSGLIPLSTRPDRRDIEAEFLRLWSDGINSTIEAVVRQREQAAAEA